VAVPGSLNGEARYVFCPLVATGLRRPPYVVGLTNTGREDTKGKPVSLATVKYCKVTRRCWKLRHTTMVHLCIARSEYEYIDICTKARFL
jgi:hypothetical protein